MKRCVQCGSDRLEDATSPDSLKLDGMTFSAELPCIRCVACGETYTHGLDIGAFEEAVARELVARGLVSASALRFLRKTAGLSGKALAELLNVSAESVSHWETGKHAIPRATWATVGALALERVAGRVDMLGCLGACAEPRREREVRLEVPRDARD